MATKKADLLTVDRPIANQNWVCLSFSCPEETIKKKELYFFEQFVKKWDFTKSMEKYIQFTNFVSFKYKIPIEKLTADFEEFVAEEKQVLLSTPIDEDYKNFLLHGESELQQQFDVMNNFKTSVQSLKVRGTYSTIEEAKIRCKLVAEEDEMNGGYRPDVFIGPIGTWLVMNPSFYGTDEQCFANEELNNLFHEKVKNQEIAKREFDERVKETKRNAIMANIEKANQTGVKLTQNIDEKGNLYSCNQSRIFIDEEDKNISNEELHRKLFEGDDVVVGETDHGRSRLVSMPKDKVNG